MIFAESIQLMVAVTSTKYKDCSIETNFKTKLKSSESIFELQLPAFRERPVMTNVYNSKQRNETIINNDSVTQSWR